jgi:hypothetical protein
MTPAVALLIVRSLLAACLYVFLAAALVVLWRDLRSPSAGRTGPVPGAHLILLGERAGLESSIPLAEINLLGRAEDNTIQIDDVTVSSHHARVSFRSGQWILEDIGSRNGTRVNGIAVEGPMVVTYGDDLQFGEVVFGLRAGGVMETPPAAGHPSAG